MGSREKVNDLDIKLTFLEGNVLFAVNYPSQKYYGIYIRKDRPLFWHKKTVHIGEIIHFNLF